MDKKIIISSMPDWKDMPEYMDLTFNHMIKLIYTEGFNHSQIIQSIQEKLFENPEIKDIALVDHSSIRAHDDVPLIKYPLKDTVATGATYFPITDVLNNIHTNIQHENKEDLIYTVFSCSIAGKHVWKEINKNYKMDKNTPKNMIFVGSGKKVLPFDTIVNDMKNIDKYRDLPVDNASKMLFFYALTSPKTVHLYTGNENGVYDAYKAKLGNKPSIQTFEKWKEFMLNRNFIAYEGNIDNYQDKILPDDHKINKDFKKFVSNIPDDRLKDIYSNYIDQVVLLSLSKTDYRNKSINANLQDYLYATGIGRDVIDNHSKFREREKNNRFILYFLSRNPDISYEQFREVFSKNNYCSFINIEDVAESNEGLAKEIIRNDFDLINKHSSMNMLIPMKSKTMTEFLLSDEIFKKYDIEYLQSMNWRYEKVFEKLGQGDLYPKFQEQMEKFGKSNYESQNLTTQEDEVSSVIQDVKEVNIDDNIKQDKSRYNKR
ncbi:hypothetical protein GUI12_01690 [Anaplasmataceae bacterium AB001_6]|nr:hypothetical protein GUI12_01690 [Anaplasmataceae bacterium AB001_6]